MAILTNSRLLTQAVTGVTDMQRVLYWSDCGLGLAHVNDAGLWVVTRYPGLSVVAGLRTWTVL